MSASRLRMLATLFLVLASAPRPAGQEPEAGFGAGEEVYRYTLAAGTITGAVVSTPEGVELRRESYVRDSEGRVVDIRIRYPDGGFSRSGGAEGRDWIVFPEGDGIYRGYHSNGKLKFEETRRGSTLISRRIYSYRGDSGTLSAVEESRPGEGWKLVADYGERGLVERETRTVSGRLDEVSIYEWDDRSRLVGILILEGRNERRVRITYGEDGTETEERTDTTGALALRIVRSSDGSTLEERYDGGALFARTFLRDGRLVREEIYSDGRLVRVREAP